MVQKYSPETIVAFSHTGLIVFGAADAAPFLFLTPSF
jgi:hypothetical protein